jgi:transcription elongation factor
MAEVPPELDALAKVALAKKRAEYESHEFVKLAEVGNMVNQAMKSIFKQLDEKGKDVTACKTMIRTINNRQANMDVQLQQLSRMKKVVDKLDSSVKQINSELETLN